MATTDRLEKVLREHVGRITDELIQARAEIVLEQYLGAENAYLNITKSAASSYADARGTVAKREAEEAKASRDALWNEFVDILAVGCVTIADTNIACVYWDLSGYGEA